MDEEKEQAPCCGPRVKDTILGILDNEITSKKRKAEPFGELLESRSFIETLSACDIDTKIRESAHTPTPIIEKVGEIVAETTPELDFKEEIAEITRPRIPVRPERPDEKLLPGNTEENQETKE